MKNDRKKPEPPAPSNPPETAPLKKGRCSRCGKYFQYRNVASHKPFPFCSERCRDVDLGKWLTGAYAIPGKPLPQPDEEGRLDVENEDAT